MRPHAELVLDDANGDDTVRIWARDPGTAAHTISISVDAANAVSGALLFKPEAAVTNGAGSVVTVDNADDAAAFRAGDRVLIDDGVNSETAIVLRIESADVRLSNALSNTYSGGTLRLDDLEAGETSFRVSDTGNASELSSGSVISLTQDAVTEDLVVDRVTVEKISSSVTSYRAVTRSGLANAYDLAPGASDVSLTSFEFDLTVDDGSAPATYLALGMDPQHRNYYRHAVNEDAAGLVYADPRGAAQCVVAAGQPAGCRCGPTARRRSRRRPRQSLSGDRL